MFKIEFLVNDKHLADVLRPLAGKAMNLQVVPVINAEMKQRIEKEDGNTIRKGKSPMEVHQQASDFQELFIKTLRRRHPAEFTGPHARDVIAELGRPSTSYYHYIRDALVKGAIRKKGKTNGQNSLTYTYGEK